MTSHDVATPADQHSEMALQRSRVSQPVPVASCPRRDTMSNPPLPPDSISASHRAWNDRPNAVSE